jgi:hypothetical protein
MVKIEILCNVCQKIFRKSKICKPNNIEQSYYNLRDTAIKNDWVYEESEDSYYCPECAEFRNLYKGKRASMNRENNPDWHYTELGDLPPIIREGITDTVIDQNGQEVFYSQNCGWLKEDEMVVVKVYKWKYKGD